MRNPTPNPAQGIFLCINHTIHYIYQYIPFYPDSYVPSINLNFANLSFPARILNSCKGLLLCSISKPFQDDVRSIYVYNPTINSYAALPDSPGGFQLGATLVFDPVKSPHYQVVSVLVIPQSHAEIQIYSSETGVWSHGGQIPRGKIRGVRYNKGVYCNGSIHWRRSSDDVGLSLRFHVGTRVLHDMPSPPVLRKQNDSGINYFREYFGESCDHLHFIEPLLPSFNVYEMKMDYSEWFVKYKVDLSPFMAGYRKVFRSCNVIRVLSLVRGENDRDSKMVFWIPGKAIKFNIVDGTSEELCNLPWNNSYVGDRFDYIQSTCNV